MRVQPRAITFDKAIALQPLQPLADRGRRQADALGELDIGNAAIPLKNREDSAVNLVDIGHLSGQSVIYLHFLRQYYEFVYITTADRRLDRDILQGNAMSPHSSPLAP